MTTHTIRFDADVPDSWSAVNPAESGVRNAAAIFVRDAERYTRRAPVIMITEHLFPNSEIDLENFALQYTALERASAIGLEITRSGYITKDLPAQYGQEMQFMLVSGVAVKLTHMTIATPTAEGETHVMEIAFSAPREQYASCSKEFSEFLKSLRVITG